MDTDGCRVRSPSEPYSGSLQLPGMNVNLFMPFTITTKILSTARMKVKITNYSRTYAVEVRYRQDEKAR